MWVWIASRILRNRAGILVVLALLTAFFAWQMTKVQVSYEFGGLLPKKDQAYIDHQDLLERFGEDGNVIVLGVRDETLYDLDNFRAWYRLGMDLKAQDGVDSVFSEAHAYTLVRNDSLRRFDLQAMLESEPQDQAEVDSVVARIRNMPFYDGLLYNKDSGASLMMVFVNAERFNSDRRGDMVDLISLRVDDFARDRTKVFRSGLPYIRTVVTERTKSELRMFVALMMLTVALLLLLFFKSWRVMWMCLLVVSIAVVWAVGSIALLGYKLTSVMAIIPPLIIVIGIPNCIFLINKYHHEFIAHGNQIKSLSRVIQRIGKAAFLTNTTTALGFATFMLTYSDVLKQFGLIAALNIFAVFVVSLLVIPILFSMQAPPLARHTSHLDRRWVDRTTGTLIHLVQHQRPMVYAVFALILVVGLIGVSRLKNESHIVDDLPTNDPVMKDLGFFEEHFNGVMPLEVIVDTRKRGQAMKDANLERIERLQDTLATYPELSRSLSIADAIKFTKQSFYSGDPERYALLKSNEKTFILPYVDGARGSGELARAFLDSTRQSTRITVQMADVGTTRMYALFAELRPQVDSIFHPDDFDVKLTGTSVVFLKGSEYMVTNLLISLGIAVVLISGIMALVFNSFRMVVISLIPNLVPLITTAGIMGYMGIAIKPSTILVFSIAFGISVDDAIHYLAKYRQELKYTGHNIRASVFQAIREAGVSMIYTSLVLFCGFILFLASDFGGTQALGVLVSITLLVAMFTNVLILPSMLLSFEKTLTTRSFEEPIVEFMGEGSDEDDEGDADNANGAEQIGSAKSGHKDKQP